MHEMPYWHLMQYEDKYMEDYADIIKIKIVPFICTSCGCSFDKAIYIFSENDGNYYFNCPRCGTDCHVDIKDVERRKEWLEEVSGYADGA